MNRFVAALAFVVGLSSGAHAQIALLTGPSDPSQLINTINQVIRAINASAFSQAFPTPAAGASTVPNAIVLTAAATGGVAQISPTTAANGGDANASLGISPSGSGNLVLFGNYSVGQATGLIQVANSASWEPRVGLAACPGYNRNGAPVGMSDNITGYLVLQDWLGKPHYVPTC